MEASLIVVEKPYVYVAVVDKEGNNPHFECMNDALKDTPEKSTITYELEATEGGLQLGELITKASQDKKQVIQAPVPLLQALCQLFEYNGNVVIVPMPEVAQSSLITPEQAGANAVQDLDALLNPTKGSGLILPR